MYITNITNSYYCVYIYFSLSLSIHIYVYIYVKAGLRGAGPRLPACEAR